MCPEYGPLPYEWDGHLIDIEALGKPLRVLILTCSDHCRSQKNLPRRKPVAGRPVLMGFDL